MSRLVNFIKLIIFSSKRFFNSSPAKSHAYLSSPLQPSLATKLLTMLSIFVSSLIIRSVFSYFDDDSFMFSLPNISLSAILSILLSFDLSYLNNLTIISMFHHFKNCLLCIIEPEGLKSQAHYMNSNGGRNNGNNGNNTINNNGGATDSNGNGEGSYEGGGYSGPPFTVVDLGNLEDFSVRLVELQTAEMELNQLTADIGNRYQLGGTNNDHITIRIRRSNLSSQTKAELLTQYRNAVNKVNQARIKHISTLNRAYYTPIQLPRER